MRFKITNKDELTRKLEDNKGNEAYLLFDCKDCGGERISYREPCEDIVKQFNTIGYIVPIHKCPFCMSDSEVYPKEVYEITMLDI